MIDQHRHGLESAPSCGHVKGRLVAGPRPGRGVVAGGESFAEHVNPIQSEARIEKLMQGHPASFRASIAHPGVDPNEDSFPQMRSPLARAARSASQRN